MTEGSERVLAECLQLLVSARCRLRQGMCLTGKLGAVSVLVMPDLVDKAFRTIQIVCHAAGHLRVDWGRFGVWVQESGGGNLPIVLNVGGRSLPVRIRYSDSASLTFRDPAMFGVEALMDVGLQLVSVGRFDAPIIKGRAGPPPRPIPLKISTDGLLSARTEILPDGSLKVEVEIADEALRHTRVALEIRSATSGKILYRTEFKLQFKSGMYGEWYLKDELLPIQETVDLFVYPVREP
jgi:hypothetical protein